MVERLAALRKLIQANGGQGFLVPRVDAYQGEFIAPCDERLAWLSGFTGSAGLGIVLLDKAAIFTDGRYTLQASMQVDPQSFEVYDSSQESPAGWLKKKASEEGVKDSVLFYDPWLLTPLQLKTWQENLGNGFALCSLEGHQNWIDMLWQDRPPIPQALLFPHPQIYAGVTSSEKRETVKETLREWGVDGFLLTTGESLAWLLNIRGGDVPHTPVAHSYGLIFPEKIELFVDLRKVTPEVKEHLGETVNIFPLEAFQERAMQLAKQHWALDPAKTPLVLEEMLKAAGVGVVWRTDPTLLGRAVKNATEWAGMERAHRIDGLAVVRFLSWLSEETEASRPVDELQAQKQLLLFRRQREELKDLSFESISAAGPNGAVVHYRADEASNRPLERGQLYLIDSGGQYLEGTTDITRTVAIGTPTLEQKTCYTLVLKGHIALARALFPRGTCGEQLDTLARQFLWQAGLDYAHGTGHGVGSYLNVHEGPQCIAKRAGTVPLRPGMVLSNEPGYYKAGSYGIRLENLVGVVEKKPFLEIEGIKPENLLGFQTLTCVPFDRRLVLQDLMSPEELTWLNGYHQWVWETLSPELSPASLDYAWLKQATERV